MTLEVILNSFANTDERDEALEALVGWLRKDGFAPVVPTSSEWRRTFRWAGRADKHGKRIVLEWPLSPLLTPRVVVYSEYGNMLEVYNLRTS